MAKLCPSCGRQNLQSAAFCAGCGTSIINPVEPNSPPPNMPSMNNYSSGSSFNQSKKSLDKRSFWIGLGVGIGIGFVLVLVISVIVFGTSNYQNIEQVCYDGTFTQEAYDECIRNLRGS